MVENHEKFIDELKTYYPHLEVILGLPKMSQIFDDNLQKLVIMDDLARQIFHSSQMVDLFSVTGRHSSVSVIFTIQNYYDTGSSKTIVRDCDTKVIFDYILEKGVIRNIGTEMVPKQPDFLNNCFDSLRDFFENEKYPYIVVDGNAHLTMNSLMFRSRIFPNAENNINPLCFFPNPQYVKPKRDK